MRQVVVCLSLVVAVACGGGDSSSPTAPTPTPTPTPEPAPAPDLVVGSPTVNDSSPAVSATFTLSTTVRNDGAGDAPATTLRAYRSTDATITTADTAEGAAAVAGLAVAGSTSASVQLTAPSTAGTYYYGACVDAVADESDTTNNCSAAVQVTVPEPTNWRQSGTGSTILDLPTRITRIRIEGEYNGSSENFVVFCGTESDRGGLLVNEILGTYNSSPRYSGVHSALRSYSERGQPCRELQILHSIGIRWTITETAPRSSLSLDVSTGSASADQDAVERARAQVMRDR